MSDGERHDEENPSTSAADDSGDLDADYLDEDAKEHLFALADKLGPSLKDIDLIKSSPAPTDPSEQDYDEKAEDAVDYEDIDEEYDGPEVEAATEEDNVLSKKDYFSSSAAYASVNNTVSVFDEENYDEDEETPNDNESPGDNAVQNLSSEQAEMATSSDNLALEKIDLLSHAEETMDIEYEVLENEMGTEEGQLQPESVPSLPVLCIEDGSVILRFSEIFGIQEPVRKVKTDHHKRPVNKDLQITNAADFVEEDEEIILRSTIQNFSTLKHIQMNENFVESDSDESVADVTSRLKDSCLSEQPMKDAHIVQQSPVCPDFYPLEHDDWENDIIWNNSPSTDRQPYAKICESEESVDTHGEDHDMDYDQASGCWDILDEKNVDHLRSHARAMIVSQSMKTSTPTVENFDNQAKTLSGRFNISNDKFYSNRKTPQQAKTHTKKRALMGIKVNLKALIMGCSSSRMSKEIANFHRPKAKWYPHENKIAAKLQGAACSHGRMTAILMTLGGKGIKILVNAEDTPVSVKLKALKKLELKPSEKIKLFCSGKELQDDISLAMQNVRPNSILHVVRSEVNLWPKAQKLPATSLRNRGDGLGTVLAIDPADKSPFLGDIRSGSHQSCLETNMYRSPVFPHKVASTDYLLVRSAKGVLSLRRIDKLYAVGQQEPHMEVFSPGTKNVQNYLLNRVLAYVYREFRARERPDVVPQIRADELPIQSPLTEAIVKKRLKHCADLKVCCYESMQAGLYRLKRLGIVKLTQPVGLASAMNQLPDEAIELAAASHIERELQITSWNLTSNFVACTNQDRENIERLEITGVGDPSGRGLGFSYVRVAPKAPASNSMLKKKSAAAKGTTVTGTDADLRRLSMDAARELLLKFGVPEEQIDKLTRWHRIAMVRKLSSEQAASGITIDEIPVSKFARGQRMSFLQLQQQTREKCQEIWDRQVQSLSAMDGDDNGSDTEANSDLDSFAGDLENLLDAEEFDDEDTSTADLRSDKADGMRGLKMRRCPTHAQINEEIEDDEAEASLAKKLLEDSGNDMKRKKQPEGLTNCGTSIGANKMKQNKTGQMIKSSGHAGALTPKESTPREAKEAENSFAEGGLPSKLKTKVAFDGNDIILVKKKSVLGKDGPKLGHMRTNKRCPKYGEDPEMSEMDANSVKSNPADIVNHLPTKTPKRLITKVSSEVNETEGPEGIEKTKSVPVKFKLGATDKSLERNISLSGSIVSDKRVMDVTDYRSTGKVNKMIIPNKMKSDDFPPDTPKPSVVFRPPAEEKDVPRKKITIKQPKVVDQQRHVEPRSVQEPIRKTRKIVELSSFEDKSREDDYWFSGEPSQMNSSHERSLGLEGKRRSKAIMETEKPWRDFEEQKEMPQQRPIDARIYASREEDHQKAKKKNKKKKKHEFRDDDLLDLRPYRNDRKVPERHRAVKRSTPVDVIELPPSAKRRRGGEVELSNILEKIVDHLRGEKQISLLFLKPVTRKDAPDYLDFIERPMDLGTIRDKVRKMEYRNRNEFRHDVAQIQLNAHIYNDQRHPHIPPLADSLMELCDYLLDESAELLDEAEDAIEQ
ncbi:hypothetical protein HU200_008480 [Digitaria exilis]|uniref:Transcription initiation factor TFIID subunit 1 n=1 Tax=Digitaria exilis TaxID=1010633 RepID=A0A835FLH2_9POAL|nr:hypothetical protein HU200_008480 [Digitaria exilis]